jgi:DNA-directed RNA polymerase subunit N (RpoN/RPB10)
MDTASITANSHKVIRNLIDATIKAADELGVDLHCCHKADEWEEPQYRLSFARSNADLLDNLVPRHSEFDRLSMTRLQRR